MLRNTLLVLTIAAAIIVVAARAGTANRAAQTNNEQPAAATATTSKDAPVDYIEMAPMHITARNVEKVDHVASVQVPTDYIEMAPMHITARTVAVNDVDFDEPMVITVNLDSGDVEACDSELGCEKVDTGRAIAETTGTDSIQTVCADGALGC